MNAHENQIVVYQPNETVRLDVRLENETVWLNRHQMAQLFGRDIKTIGKHIANALSEELAESPLVANLATTQSQNSPTVAKFATVQQEGGREVVRQVECGKFTKTICGICHDRFIIVDQKEIFWTGALLKDGEAA